MKPRTGRPSDPRFDNNPIRRRRLRVGWTTAELCARANISARTLAKIERGEVVPGLASLRKLAGAFLEPPMKLLVECERWRERMINAE